MSRATNTEVDRRAELATFLRTRRAGLQPSDVGLRRPAGRRNTPGLRREEVAQVSGVGVTWYTWLEQARPITTTESVIDALARAFRLDRESHGHLRQLAGLPMPEPDEMPDGADPALAGLLDTLMPAPACLLGPRFDYVAWNDAYAKVWDPGSLPPARRNVIWLTFTDAGRRRTWVDWEARSRVLLAEFRAAAGQHAGDPRFAELVAALSEASEEFRTYWAQYEVRQSITGPLAIRRPPHGVIRFHVVELCMSAYPLLRLAVHLPARSSDAHRLTALLGAPLPAAGEA